MLRSMLQSKIHHAHVTSADLNYVGSITIDKILLEKANILPYEKVLVVDVENGARFETYTMEGTPNSGTIQLNGAAARLACVGDRVIIMSFVLTDAADNQWKPTILQLNEKNEITSFAAGSCKGC